MSSTMKTECKSATRQLAGLLTLSLSGGTRRWTNGAAISSETLGIHRGLILEAGSLPWGVTADRDFAISPIEISPTVSDVDNDFSNYLESSNGQTLITSP